MEKKKNGYGQVQLFTGDGKGKTTAALGEVLRTAGAGKRTAIVYFDKGGEHYSERQIFDNELVGKVDYFVYGRDRMDMETGSFDFSIVDDDKVQAEQALTKTKELFENGEYDLLVLDEVNIATAMSLINEDEVMRLLQNKPESLEVIMTGRNAPKSFIDWADLVTEVKMVKHYIEKGVKAREGLDY